MQLAVADAELLVLEEEGVVEQGKSVEDIEVELFFHKSSPNERGGGVSGVVSFLVWGAGVWGAGG